MLRLRAAKWLHRHSSGRLEDIAQAMKVSNGRLDYALCQWNGVRRSNGLLYLTEIGIQAMEQESIK